MLSKQIVMFLGALVLLGAATFFAVRAYVIQQAPVKVMASIEARIVHGAGRWNACNHNRVYGPRKNAARRANPDSIITSMAYDLAGGPVRVSGVVWPDYWSLSLYQQNSDNYFVVNDQQLEQPTFDFVILGQGQTSDIPASTVVMSPTQKGIMLIRRFAKQDADMPAILDNQDAMLCGPASKP